LAGGASAVATVPADRWDGTRFTAADGLGGAARARRRRRARAAGASAAGAGCGGVPPYGGGRGGCH
jgi:hypothetical protein